MVRRNISMQKDESPLVRSLRFRTILIVEHDPSQAESFIKYVSFNAHHYVKLVSSAEAALQFVKHIKPTLFLLVHHPPAMDGLALYEQLHESRGLASTPAIIVGVLLPKRVLAMFKTQQLVLLNTPVDLEELGRALAQFDLSFVMHDERLRGFPTPRNPTIRTMNSEVT
jgi:CheY-like chemotaxis protein